MANLGALKFEATDEPIVRASGRKKQEVPADIKAAVAGAIKTGKVLSIEIESSKVATLRRLIKRAAEEAGAFTVNSQDIQNPETKRSLFKFEVKPAASE